MVTFAINGFAILSILLFLAYGDFGSHGLKVNLVFLITAGLVAIIPTVTNVTSKEQESVCFWVTISLLTLVGIIQAISNAACFAYMSVIPDSKYMATLSVAMGVAALLLNALSALSLLLFPNKQLLEVDVFYFVSAFILILAALAYFIEKNNPFS